MAKKAGVDVVAKPNMFQLTTNYRSHRGIVNCANTITQLIHKFWPETIDKLDRESGIVDGTKPLFLSGWDQDNARYEQFLFGDRYVPFSLYNLHAKNSSGLYIVEILSSLEQSNVTYHDAFASVILRLIAFTRYNRAQ
jgi:hypothetical protein